MTIERIIARRLEILIETTLQERIDLSGNPKLGDSPIGWDSTFIKGQFRGYLNGNRSGFADLLEENVFRGEIGTGTKFNKLVEIIVGKSEIKNRNDYRTKMTERVRIALRSSIAGVSDPIVHSQDVLPEKPIRSYLREPKNQALREVRAQLQTRLRKYLLSRIRLNDLNGLVRRGAKRITLKTLA